MKSETMRSIDTIDTIENWNWLMKYRGKKTYTKVRFVI
jgi:hypothetical protein